MKLSYFILPLLLLFYSCQTKDKKKIGSIERLNPSLDAIISPDAQPEIITEGYVFTEGPLWLESDQKLLFTDIPPNVVYQWTEKEGASLYLKPSGYTGTKERGGEPGANGLALDNQGRLVLCQHGDRRVAFMNSPLNMPASEFTTVADLYDGKRFNSPNDLCIHQKGEIIFTDPPYGLEKNMDDPSKEISFQGVYAISPSGKVRLLIDSLTRPNGIAFSPDQKKIYISNSDPMKARWYEYSLDDSLRIVSGKVFYSVPESMFINKNENPDGLKVDSQGNIFATGPGGVLVFNSHGALLGRILIPYQTANCALSEDNKTLFLTSDNYVIRVRLRK